MPVLIEMTNLIILVTGHGQGAGHGLVADPEDGHVIVQETDHVTVQGLGQEAVLGVDLGIGGSHVIAPVRDLEAARGGGPGGGQGINQGIGPEIEEGHGVVQGAGQGIGPGLGRGTAPGVGQGTALR